MNPACRETVVAALARHLDVDPLAIEISQRLDGDWGLDTLDLALLALRLEELLDIEIPLSALGSVATVADLVVVARAAADRADDELGLQLVHPSLRARIRRRTRPQPARVRRRERPTGRPLSRTVSGLAR
jgi:acyl carrier protein